MKKVIEQIRLKADACGDVTKEQRARKGAYIDCLVLLKEALRQCNVVRQSEQLPILDRCECEEPKEEPIKICMNCNGYIE